jgi:hypothetical protein
MSTNTDPRRSIAAWLEAEAPDRAPGRLIDASRERIRSTRQRPGFWPARRTTDMNSYAKWLIAAAAVLVVALVGYHLFPSQRGVGGPPVSASPTPSPAITTSPSIDTSPPKLDGSSEQSRPLEPGTYTVTLPGSGVDISFTVPTAGWTWYGGWFLSKTGSDAPDGQMISFWHGDFQVYTDPCQWEGNEPEPPTGLKALDLVTALTTQPQRNASNVTERKASGSGDAGLGTLPGYSVDLSVPADADFSKCDQGQFRSWGPTGDELYAGSPAQRDTVWAIDADPDTRVVILRSFYPATPAATMTESDQILDSMRFGAAS